jgi:transposase
VPANPATRASVAIGVASGRRSRGAAAPSGWLTRCRRLCRDYERTVVHAGDFIKIVMIRSTVARLAGQPTRYRNIRLTTP